MEVTKRPIWTLLALTLTCASVTQAVRISFLAIDPDGKEITDPQDCLQYFENVDLRSRMRNRIVMGRPESNIDAIKDVPIGESVKLCYNARYRGDMLHLIRKRDWTFVWMRAAMRLVAVEEDDKCVQSESQVQTSDILAERITSTVDECQLFCNLIHGCDKFTYNSTSSVCDLKHTEAPKTGRLTGPRICPQAGGEPKEDLYGSV